MSNMRGEFQTLNESYSHIFRQQQLAEKVNHYKDEIKTLTALKTKFKSRLSAQQLKKINKAISARSRFVNEHAYVDVMPHQNRKIDPNALTVDQAYALQTKGYKRNEPKLDPSAQYSPPPATPNSDRQPNFYNAGADPLNSVMNDRLNSDERFDDYVKKQAMTSQVELNQALAQAYQNVAHQAANKARVKNQMADRQALENWMDATGYSPGTVGGGCSNC